MKLNNEHASFNDLSEKSNYIQKTDNSKIAMLFLAFFSYNLVTALVNVIVNFVFPNTPVDTIICTLILAFFVFRAIGPIMRNTDIKDFVFVFICIAVCVCHMVAYPGIFDIVLEKLPKFVFTILPLYLLGKSIKDYKMLLEYFQKASNVLVWVAFGYYFLLIINGKDLYEDHMSFAYYVLPVVIIRFYSLINSFSVKNFIYFAVATSTMILTGTRGPFLCLVVSIILFVLFGSKKALTKVIWISMLIGFTIFFFSDSFTAVLESINTFLLKHDIENRIIAKLLEEEFFNDSGRGNIQSYIKDAIMQKPFLGNGVFSDRVKFGTYAHNIFYELLLHFGCVIGFVIFTIVALQIFNALRRKDHNYRVIAILCICCSYVKLFVSGSYIEEPIFFLMLGIVI